MSDVVKPIRTATEGATLIAQPSCLECVHSFVAMEPALPALACGHPDSGKRIEDNEGFNLKRVGPAKYLPLIHCSFDKFEKDPKKTLRFDPDERFVE